MMLIVLIVMLDMVQGGTNPSVVPVAADAVVAGSTVNDQKKNSTSGRKAGGLRALQQAGAGSAEDEACSLAAVESTLAACCAGHRRQLQGGGGCTNFPPMCSAQCAAQLVPLYEACPSFVREVASTGGEGFYLVCAQVAWGCTDRLSVSTVEQGPAWTCAELVAEAGGCGLDMSMVTGESGDAGQTLGGSGWCPASCNNPCTGSPQLVTACSTIDEFSARAAELTAECCDEPAESCAHGYPSTCNAGCAAILLPIRASC